MDFWRNSKFRWFTLTVLIPIVLNIYKNMHVQNICVYANTLSEYVWMWNLHVLRNITYIGHLLKRPCVHTVGAQFAEVLRTVFVRSQGHEHFHFLFRAGTRRNPFPRPLTAGPQWLWPGYELTVLTMPAVKQNGARRNSKGSDEKAHPK